MGERRKLSLPVPPALMSPLNLPRGGQVLEMEIVLPAPRTDNEARFEKIVRDKTADALEDAMNSLRLDGASEQQLGAVMGATRLECLLRLLNMDLESIVLDYITSGGTTASLREIIALALVPELGSVL